MAEANDDPSPRLVDLVVTDPGEAWDAAGFAVDHGGTVRLGNTTVRLVEAQGQGKGIVGWTLGGLAVTNGHLDGLPTAVASAGSWRAIDGSERSQSLLSTKGRSNAPPRTQKHDPVAAAEPDASIATNPIAAPTPTTHPNGATGIDHVVLSTPDLERTIAACEAAGLHCRRIRDAGTAEHPLRQAFFRLGPTVLEVVGGAPTITAAAGTTRGPDEATATTTDPARWFGLAVDVADLDETAALLGSGLGRIKPAVQAGRRIATLRHRDLGLSVAVALMDDHGDR